MKFKAKVLNKINNLLIIFNYIIYQKRAENIENSQLKNIKKIKNKSKLKSKKQKQLEKC